MSFLSVLSVVFIFVLYSFFFLSPDGQLRSSRHLSLLRAVVVVVVIPGGVRLSFSLLVYTRMFYKSHLFSSVRHAGRKKKKRLAQHLLINWNFFFLHPTPCLCVLVLILFWERIRRRGWPEPTNDRPLTVNVFSFGMNRSEDISETICVFPLDFLKFLTGQHFQTNLIWVYDCMRNANEITLSPGSKELKQQS